MVPQPICQEGLFWGNPYLRCCLGATRENIPLPLWYGFWRKGEKSKFLFILGTEEMLLCSTETGTYVKLRRSAGILMLKRSYSLHCWFHMCSTDMKYCQIVLSAFAHALQRCLWLQIMENRADRSLLLAGSFHCPVMDLNLFVMKCEELITAQLHLQIHCSVLMCLSGFNYPAKVKLGY